MTTLRTGVEAGPPSDLEPDRLSRLASPLLAAAGLTLAVAVVHVRDPHDPGSYAYCPFHLLTGLYCPGCGGLRAVHDLTHGNVGDALSSNLIVVAMVLPLLAVTWLNWLQSRWRGRPLAATLPTQRLVWCWLVLVLAFAVARNLPFGAWLAP
jgi:Protein of unknown function (DUF2752)